MGSYEDAFIAPAKDAMKAPGAIPTHPDLTQIEMWKFVETRIGLVVAAGLLALTVWLRRRRDRPGLELTRQRTPCICRQPAGGPSDA